MVEMRAAVHGRYGGPETLHEATIAAPVPSKGELLIRVCMASVNGYDTLVRSGALRLFQDRRFPKQTGLDFAGEVVTASGEAPHFEQGDRVWGVMPLHRLGSIAEYVCVAPRQVARSPAGLSAADAAALPVVGVTALIGLRDVGHLRRGQRLLVRGASGGVGSIAVQIGKALGAHVTGLASAAKLDLVRGLGADEALDYRKVGPAGPGEFDVILDTVGTDIAAWRRRLARTGRMAAIVPDAKHPLRSMAYFAWSRVHGVRRVRYFSAKPDSALLDDLADLVTRGAVRPIIDTIHPLSRIADAHLAFEAGGRHGKQIIRIDR